MKGDKSKRIYVTVESVFDQTGYMQPVSITWNHHVIPVQVRDFRPAASMAGEGKSGDCYTVLIGSQEKHLFFERASHLFPSRVGRWFVEVD
ncbi:MAG: hypothetical protein DUD27_02735 [Lachnospiraceae bacterium]|uniref:Uncharacterized protein n=1 Tax=Candidatus Weimeria bifida TaxID=2599074 RepID=A0A6N7J0F3_9FIRM|nr:hypothetical protein [Candidatus Weimeria bifida]RRF96923.1 MAG: hypothetical protein DUD27_02735 [Lachnospiraceae bacterium]